MDLPRSQPNNSMPKMQSMGPSGMPSALPGGGQTGPQGFQPTMNGAAQTGLQGMQPTMFSGGPVGSQGMQPTMFSGGPVGSQGVQQTLLAGGHSRSQGVPATMLGGGQSDSQGVQATMVGGGQPLSLGMQYAMMGCGQSGSQVMAAPTVLSGGPSGSTGMQHVFAQPGQQQQQQQQQPQEQQQQQQQVMPGVEYTYVLLPANSQVPPGVIVMGQIPGGQEIPQGLPYGEVTPEGQIMVSQSVTSNVNGNSMGCVIPAGKGSQKGMLPPSGKGGYQQRQGPRQGRGRSPQGRGTRFVREEPVDRDWASVRSTPSRPNGQTARPTRQPVPVPSEAKQSAQPPTGSAQCGGKGGPGAGLGAPQQAPMQQPSADIQDAMPKLNMPSVDAGLAPPVQPMAPGPTNGVPGAGGTKPGAKEPWRPQVPFGQRRQSIPERPGGAHERRQSGERKSSLERRRSAERRFFGEQRRGSMQRRHSFDGPRRARSVGAHMGPPRGPMYFDQPAPNTFWLQPLPSGRTVQTWLVADQSSLSRAVQRLASLNGGVFTAVDCQGVNISPHSPGRLCLIQLAFEEHFPECYLFDVVQLGERINQLKPFLQDPQASKLVFNVSTLGVVLAHQFGIPLAGVIDATWAFEVLRQTPLRSVSDLLEYAHIAPFDLAMAEKKYSQESGVWARRPLAWNLLSYAAQSISTMQAAGPNLWSKLLEKYGNSAYDIALIQSQQRVSQAATLGWQLRDTVPWQFDGPANPEDDPEWKGWLAKRFGNPDAGGKGGGSARARSSSKSRALNPNIRPGDSPRTVSWRMAVAEASITQGDEAVANNGGARERSGSPSLKRWLERREALQKHETRVSRRASSMPPSRSSGMDSNAMQHMRQDNPWMPPMPHIPLDPRLLGLDGERRDWAETTDEALEEHMKKEAENAQFMQYSAKGTGVARAG